MNDAVQKPSLIIRQYSQLTPYAERFAEMKALTEQRCENTPDELWILQHHDVLTQARPANLSIFCSTAASPWCRPTAAAK